LDPPVVVEKVDAFHVFQLGENPGGQDIAAILGKDDVISDINARMKGVSALGIQEE
jgi:hypothetical protein